MFELLRLYQISNRLAFNQSHGFSSHQEERRIDQIVKRLRKRTILLDDGKNYYFLPVNHSGTYWRPLFKMKTHRLIIEAGADDTNAVDFDVPLGTAVYAVESGIVVALKNDSNEGGNDPKYASSDNYIYILNKEKNLIFCYRHLDPENNISLKIFIEKNQLLGYTSLTGYVIEPHLHFVIYDVMDKGTIRLSSRRIKFKLK